MLRSNVRRDRWKRILVHRGSNMATSCEGFHTVKNRLLLVIRAMIAEEIRVYYLAMDELCMQSCLISGDDTHMRLLQF